MQCQSQIAQPSLDAALGIKAAIQKMNRAWFANKHPIKSDKEDMEAFPDIDSMTIERFYNNFINSKGDPRHRIVELGLWSVDIKLKIKFFSDNPNDIQMHRLVLRGQAHFR